MDTSKKGGSPMRNIAIGLVVALVVLVAGALLIFTLGLYKFGWEGPAAQIATKALPYPAATVNGTAIRYSDYLDDVATLERFFNAQLADGAPAESVPTPEEIRENALDRLVFNVILAQEAEARGLTVTQEDLDAEFDVLTSQSGGEEKVAAEIEQLYGWDIEQFKNKVIWTFILQGKIEEALRNDPELVGPARAEADSVLAELQAGGDFAELAMLHSDDQATAATGGELGAFGPGIMVPEFEAAAFAMEVGETSGVVETDYGFHIIRVEEIEEEDGEVVSVTARHILIMPPTADQYLSEKMDAADVVRYVKI